MTDFFYLNDFRYNVTVADTALKGTLELGNQSFSH